MQSHFSAVQIDVIKRLNKVEEISGSPKQVGVDIRFPRSFNCLAHEFLGIAANTAQCQLPSSSVEHPSQNLGLVRCFVICNSCSVDM